MVVEDKESTVDQILTAMSAEIPEVLAGTLALLSTMADDNLVNRVAVCALHVRLLSDANPVVRVAAAESIWRLQDRAAVEHIDRALDTEAQPHVKRTLEHVRRVLGEPPAMEGLAAAEAELAAAEVNCTAAETRRRAAVKARDAAHKAQDMASNAPHAAVHRRGDTFTMDLIVIERNATRVVARPVGSHGPIFTFRQRGGSWVDGPYCIRWIDEPTAEPTPTTEPTEVSNG